MESTHHYHRDPNNNSPPRTDRLQGSLGNVVFWKDMWQCKILVLLLKDRLTSDKQKDIGSF